MIQVLHWKVGNDELSRHVINQRVIIDMSVLCGFIEHICTLTVVAKRLASWNSVHAVIIPRSWLEGVQHLFTQPTRMETSNFLIILEPLGKLIDRVHSGTQLGLNCIPIPVSLLTRPRTIDELRHEGRELSKVPRPIRAAFVFRM